MYNKELLGNLSAYRFYRDYLAVCPESKPPPVRRKVRTAGRAVSAADLGAAARPANLAEAVSGTRTAGQVFLQYSLLLGGLLLGSVLLIVAPLWLVYPPFGKACLLSIPPMFLCALSWMVGAWWGWNRNEHMLMAVTVGAMPARIVLVLAWTWLVSLIPGMAMMVFVLGMMLHWIVFTAAEMGMLMELTKRSPKRSRPGASG
jgi:hypothetical protein